MNRNERHNGAFSDGAPRESIDSSRGVGSGKTGRITDDVSHRVSRVMQFEGLRGRSTRAAVILRYVAYMFAVAICSSLTQVFTSGLANVSGGGWFMLLCITTIGAVGAGATMVYPNLRPELVQRSRFYMFNVVCVPGTLFAAVLRTAQHWMGTDTLGRTLGMAIPLIFLSTLILPALVFVKEIVGLRGVSRSKLDDEEAVLLWTRQSDGMSR